MEIAAKVGAAKSQFVALHLQEVAQRSGLNRILHSRMLYDHTPTRLKRASV
jgi:hypothetical protein